MANGGPRNTSQTRGDPWASRYLDFPYSVSSTGVPNTTPYLDHIRDLVMQVLFTIPGERVNLPEFGVGVQRLVFAPNNEALRTGAQFLISSNLNRWLGERIEVNQVSVTSELNEEEKVTIEIFYTIKATQQRQQLRVRI